MSPLNTYFRWTSAIKLRKSAGLWAFGFAVLHVFFYTSDTGWLTLVSAAASVSLRHVFSYISYTGWTWLTVSMQPFMALGLLGLLVLAALAITSNRWAMRRLKKYWKRLHRLVYVAGLSVVFHAILSTNASKKLFIRDPEAIHELRLYLALMVVLLVVRIPVVRRLLKQIPRLLRHRRRAGLQVTPVAIPDSLPEHLPQVNGREAGLPADDFLSDAQYEEEVERLPAP
jgi:sulfoxide reductase heme-binding subunit YedZ